MLNGKQCTGQKQENIAIDDSGAAKMLCDKRTTACTEDEEENHAVIMQAFIAAVPYRRSARNETIALYRCGGLPVHIVEA